MQNTQLLQSQVMKLLGLSSMEPKEKSFWASLIPNMKTEDLKKLETILDKEVSSFIDLAMKQKLA